jgi:hypothetical protein
MDQEGAVVAPGVRIRHDGFFVATTREEDDNAGKCAWNSLSTNRGRSNGPAVRIAHRGLDREIEGTGEDRSFRGLIEDQPVLEGVGRDAGNAERDVKEAVAVEAPWGPILGDQDLSVPDGLSE